MRWCVFIVIAGAASGGAGSLEAQQLRYGKTLEGRLTRDAPQFGDSSHYRRFEFAARVGDTVTAVLESDDFDANLILTDAAGNRLRADLRRLPHSGARDHLPDPER